MTSLVHNRPRRPPTRLASLRPFSAPQKKKKKKGNESDACGEERGNERREKMLQEEERRDEVRCSSQKKKKKVQCYSKPARRQGLQQRDEQLVS